MIVAVLPPTAARNDRGDKRLAYEQLETLKEYALIWQHRIRVEVRSIENDEVIVLESETDVLRLASLGFEMDVASLYG